ncbi:MAG: DUF2064 domain-containing protein [Planctomycetes bacterium]|nr:DUF2064 domain-containing protein [Planctomycetota bacterium]
MSTFFGMLAADPQARSVRPGLVDALGAPAAVKVYRSFIMDLCERFSHLSADNRVLAYAPRGARKSVALLASRQWRLVQQEGGSRGQVLANLFDCALRLGARRAVLLLTACPTVPDAFIIEAFDRLLIEDVVLGPTTQGGLYLVGLSLERPELFLGVDFGGPGVFDALVGRADAFGLVLGLVPHWYEVEDRAGLDLLASHLRALALAGSDAMPRRTQTLFQKLKLVR